MWKIHDTSVEVIDAESDEEQGENSGRFLWHYRTVKFSINNLSMK